MRICTIAVAPVAICSLPLAAYTNLGSNVLMSDGTAADTQAAINAASNGWTVKIPEGTFAWSTEVTTAGKGIKLQGAGTSQYLGWSTTSATIGTGTKTFITQSGLPIINGQSLRIQKTGGETNNTTTGAGTGNYPWMEGTVTSYSGTTLVMNMTSTNYSGTWSNWYIATLARTTLINNVSSGNALITLTENMSNTAELSDLRLQLGTGIVDMVRINPVTNGKPVQIHDCWLQSGNGTVDCIQSYTRAGIVYRTVLEAPGFSMAPTGFHHKMNADVDSWATASNWGAADTTGTANFYFEDCTFIAFLNATDLDDNSRCSIRYSFFDHAAVGTHGADTGSPAIGCRYFDVSDSEFHYVNDGVQSLALNWWFYIRGGTFAVHDSIIPQINSGGWWGNKAEFNMTVMNLQRNAGSFPLWGDNLAGNQYPAPRQVGRGNPNGLASTFDPAGITVMGDLEPAYIWGNTGSYDISLSDYGANGGISPDSTSGYIVAGRDYYNNGTAKPGYTKYPYPHPLRTGSAAIAPVISTQPLSQTIIVGASVSFTVAASGTPTPDFQWRKDGVNITGATSAIYAIASTTMGDAGSYTVVITNTGGSVTSNVAVLSLIPTGFDVAGYYARNQDVAAYYGGDPYGAWQHFWQYGLAEGRQFDSQFIVDEYLELNSDLKAAFGSNRQAALLHWLTYGKPVEDRIGRVPIGFNVDSYLARYPDLAAAFGSITPTAVRNVTVWNHYLDWGVREGRSDGDFEAYGYLATNPDLAAVFGTDVEAAALHWYFYGRREGRRIPANFDVVGYRTRNPDIAVVWGNDLYGSWLHYRDTGVTEGRVYDDLFRVLEYRSRYPDVQATYGSNLSGIALHWLFFGKAEGRLGRNP